MAVGGREVLDREVDQLAGVEAVLGDVRAEVQQLVAGLVVRVQGPVHQEHVRRVAAGEVGLQLGPVGVPVGHRDLDRDVRVQRLEGVDDLLLVGELGGVAPHGVGDLGRRARVRPALGRGRGGGRRGRRDRAARVPAPGGGCRVAGAGVAGACVGAVVAVLPAARRNEQADRGQRRQDGGSPGSPERAHCSSSCALSQSGPLPPSHPGSHSASAVISSSVMCHASSSVSRAWTLRVREDRVVDEVAVLVEGRPDGQLLAVDGGPGVRGALRRQRPDGHRVDAEPVHEGRDLDAGVRAEVRDQRAAAGTGRAGVVHHVGDDPGRTTRDHRVDDHRGVLAAALDLERLARVEAALRVRVVVEVVRDPGQVLPDRDVVRLDLALGDEPRVVLRVVLGGFGRVEAEAREQVGPDQVVVRHPARLDERAEVRVEVPAAVLQAQDPGEVVDAGGQRVHLRDRDAQVPGQAVHGPVDGMAQARDRRAQRLVHRPDEHPHRVRVVEQQRPRACLGHVGRDPQHDRDRPQAAENAADVDRVVDRVRETVAARDVEVQLGGPRATDLDRVDDEVGAGERLPAVEGPGDGRGRSQDAGRPGRHALGRPEAVRVDVVHHELGLAQLRVRQDVAQQVPGELHAARSDEHDPGHVAASPAPRIWVSPWLWYRSIQPG